MFDLLRDLIKPAVQKNQELINSYLDDALTPRQRQRFEQRLSQDADLQADLAQRRLLKQQLRQLPQRRVPRSFVLDPAVYGRPQRQPLLQLYPAMRVATVLTAFLFVVVLSLDMFMLGGASESAAPAAADVAMVMEEPAAEMPAADQVESVETVTELVEGEIVEQAQVVAEAETVVEEVESVKATDDAGSQPTAEPAAAAMAEEAAADTAAEEPASAEEPMAEAPAPEVGSTEEGSGELMATTTAPSLLENTPLPSPMPSATLSPAPQVAADTDGAASRAGSVTASPEAAMTELTNETPPAEPSSQPNLVSEPERGVGLTGLQIAQIGLGIAVLLLALVTFYLRRQLWS